MTEQEAVNIAAYVYSKPRSAFVLKDRLPNDGKLSEYNEEPERQKRLAHTRHRSVTLTEKRWTRFCIR